MYGTTLGGGNYGDDNGSGGDGGAAPVVAGDGSGGVPMLLGEVVVVGAAAATLAAPGVAAAASLEEQRQTWLCPSCLSCTPAGCRRARIAAGHAGRPNLWQPALGRTRFIEVRHFGFRLFVHIIILILK
jgi:hypothetical protein